MADEIAADGDVPPAGEAVHLPGPSYLPVLVAFGVTLAVVGVVINVVMFAIGVAITLVATARWVGQTREEIAELPLEH
jgi:hypothetical protein